MSNRDISRESLGRLGRDTVERDLQNRRDRIVTAVGDFLKGRTRPKSAKVTP